MGSVPSAPAARAGLPVLTAGPPPVRARPTAATYGPAVRLVVGRVLRDLRPVAAGALGVDADLAVTDPSGVRVGPLDTDPPAAAIGSTATVPAAPAVTASTAATATTTTPTAATLTAAMRAREQDWGTLEVTRRDGRAWEDRHLPMVGLVADVAASCVAMAEDPGRPAPGADPDAVVGSRAPAPGPTGVRVGPDGTSTFEQRLAEAVARSGPRHRTRVAVFLVRVDPSPSGAHPGRGDGPLAREVARRLRLALPEHARLHRLRDGDLAVLYEALAGSDAAIRCHLGTVAIRLRDAVVRSPAPVDGVDEAVSVTVGVAVSQPGSGVDDLVAAADAAVEEARRDGPGRVAVGRAGDGPPLGSRGELEGELSRALGAGQLRLHYQPIVTVGTVGTALAVDPAAGHRLVAVEALLRWEHPTRGLLAAGDFVALAERTGAIGPIGHWVVEQTCAQLAAWRTQLPASVCPRAFVNLSPRELADPGLAVALARSTAAHAVQPDQLGLEIVEGDFADPAILTSLADHQAHGHPLAIDDFGTGYSSLSRLVDLPVAFVKIDRSLVTGLAHDVRRRRLVDAVVLVAHTLGAAVIAEGVESVDQLGSLRRAGCDLLQGNLLGRPVPGDELSGRWVEAAAAELAGAAPVGQDTRAAVGAEGPARAAFDCLVTGAA